MGEKEKYKIWTVIKVLNLEEINQLSGRPKGNLVLDFNGRPKGNLVLDFRGRPKETLFQLMFLIKENDYVFNQVRQQGFQRINY